MSLESSHQHLFQEAEKIVHALGKMFAPFCEVVLHDLRTPEKSIVAIKTPISGRKIGDSTTEMGLARIADPGFPDVVQNYANRFPDGRAAKSTSIGLRDEKGKCIGAICLNLDVAMFSALQQSLGQFVAISEESGPVRETLQTRSLEEIRSEIDSFAAGRNLPPGNLDTKSRRELLASLADRGALGLRGAPALIAAHLGISRASLYNDLKVPTSK